MCAARKCSANSMPFRRRLSGTRGILGRSKILAGAAHVEEWKSDFAVAARFFGLRADTKSRGATGRAPTHHHSDWTAIERKNCLCAVHYPRLRDSEYFH